MRRPHPVQILGLLASAAVASLLVAWAAVIWAPRHNSRLAPLRETWRADLPEELRDMTLEVEPSLQWGVGLRIWLESGWTWEPGQLQLVSATATEAGWPFPCFRSTEATQAPGTYYRGLPVSNIFGESADFGGRLPVRPLPAPLLVNILLYSTAIYMLLIGASCWRRRCRRLGNRCLRCNYDLAGLSGRCPECAAPAPFRDPGTAM